MTCAYTIKNLAHRAFGLCRGRDEEWRKAIGTGVPGGRAAADLNDLSTSADIGRGLMLFREGRAHVIASEGCSIGAVENGEAHVVVKPLSRVRRELGMNSQSWHKRLAPRLGDCAQ